MPVAKSTDPREARTHGQGMRNHRTLTAAAILAAAVFSFAVGAVIAVSTASAAVRPAHATRHAFAQPSVPIETDAWVSGKSTYKIAEFIQIPNLSNTNLGTVKFCVSIPPSTIAITGPQLLWGNPSRVCTSRVARAHHDTIVLLVFTVSSSDFSAPVTLTTAVSAHGRSLSNVTVPSQIETRRVPISDSSIPLYDGMRFLYRKSGGTPLSTVQVQTTRAVPPASATARAGFHSTHKKTGPPVVSPQPTVFTPMEDTSQFWVTSRNHHSPVTVTFIPRHEGRRWRTVTRTGSFLSERTIPEFIHGSYEACAHQAAFRSKTRRFAAETRCSLLTANTPSSLVTGGVVPGVSIFSHISAGKVRVTMDLPASWDGQQFYYEVCPRTLGGSFRCDPSGSTVVTHDSASFSSALPADTYYAQISFIVGPVSAFKEKCTFLWGQA
jgi:hypothetical protein